MTELKCPVCNKQMKIGTLDLDDSMGTVWMSIMPCNCVCSYGASKAVWQELIRTRKALEIAVNMLKDIDKTRCGVDVKLYAVNHKSLNAGNVFCWTTIDDLHNVLEQITALEQKE